MTNSRVVLLCLLSWLAFIPGLWFAPFVYFLDVVNALGFTFGVAVLWRYAPGAVWVVINAIRGKRLGRGAMLVFGIEQTWAAMVIRTCAIWWWRWLGEPDGGLDSVPMAIAAFLIIGGGACHAAASASREDDIEVPVLSARLLWGALGSGLILGAGIAAGRWNIAS